MTFDLYDGPPHRGLYRNEVRELLSSLPCIPDPELSDPLFKAYRLPDDRLLIHFVRRGTGILYESHADYLAWLAAIQTANAQPRHLLVGLLAENDLTQFVSHLPQLLAELPERAGLDPKLLDGSVASLDRLHRRIKRRKDFLKPSLFPYLLAYAGEVLCRLTEGHWESHPAIDDPAVHEPLVVGCDGRRHRVFLAIYRTVDEGVPLGAEVAALAAPPLGR